MINKGEIKKLRKIAKEVRKDILLMTSLAGSGHPGSALSAADIVVALYFHKMKHDPKNPKWEERDRFILSKGHAVPLVYACLAELGYFPKKELRNLRKINSILPGHPDMSKTPGIEISTGSLGQGLSVGNGMALAGKLDKKNFKVYVLIGDGESQEGQIWEAAMTSAHFKLDNLVVILDHNQLQIDGNVSEIMEIRPLTEKWQSFGWEVIEINGHDFREILEAFKKAEKVKGKPTIIIAKTIKGKGVSFMENKPGWGNRVLTKRQLKKALNELT